MPAPFSGALRALRAARGPGPALLLLPGGAVLGLLGLWAAFAPVPLQLRSADAQLELRGGALPLSAPVSGRVRAVHLRLHEPVETGALLVQLDDDLQRAALTEELARGAALEAELAPLRAARAAAARAAGEGRAARSALRVEEAASQRAAEAAAAEAEAEAARVAQLAAAGAVGAAAPLSARAAAAAARAEADRRRAGANRQLREATGETAVLEAEIAELDHRIAAASGAVEVSAAAAARLAAEVERRALRAPAAGRLGAVAALRPGDAVDEGAELATILPEAPLQVVAAFDPGPALGHLRPGQRARLRLAAFPWTVWGAVDAEVIAVADAPLGGALRVELRPLPAPGGPPLQHGQPLEVEVDAGETTALALILRAAAQLGPAPAPAP